MNSETRVAILAISIVIPLSALALWSSDNSRSTTVAESQQMKVLVSFNPLYEFTKEIGKERVDVSMIIPNGIEPHDWEPTIQDIQKMKNADMVVINGGGFEPWIEKLTSINSKILIVDTSDSIPLLNKDQSGFGNTFQKDPHFWLDPILAKKQVLNIAKGLIKIDPDNAKYYQENADIYNTKLDLLDKKIRTELSICNKKDFLAFHNAFSYFANEYGLNQHAIITNIDENAEPTAGTLEQVMQKAKALRLRVIFTEEAVNPRISEVVASEIGGKVLVLSPMEVNPENIGYVKKMEQNLSNLKEALCT
ncbi:MAG: zinc ABC transporter substrate-binding protein [Thaumarchaeota archaeon]|nr:zinc ABC transporter substrate-binding protein [Nitrososphaerota archaeon]